MTGDRNTFYTLLSGAAVLLLTLLMGGLSGAPIPDSEFFPDADRIYELHDTMNQQQIENYRRLRIVDMLYPAVYLLFFTLSLRHLVQRASGKACPVWCAGILPLIAAGFDYGENILLWQILTAYPSRIDAAHVTRWFTAGKWLSIATIAGAAAVLAVISTIKRRNGTAVSQ